MKRRDEAAAMLDATLDAEVRKLGTITDQVRDRLAAWLDGQYTLRDSTVRKLIGYLRMIARSN